MKSELTEKSLEFANQSKSGTSDNSKEFEQKCCTALKELKLGYDIEDPDDSYSSQWPFSKLCGRILKALLAGENITDPWFHSANEENSNSYYAKQREEQDEECMDWDGTGPYLHDLSVQEELDYNHEQLPMPRRKG
jgi:hypothetical protein